MKTYTAILVKSETVKIEGENIYDAIKQGEDEAKKRGFKLVEIEDFDENLTYKVKVEIQ